MSYLEELLPEFRKGVKIRQTNWDKEKYIFYTGSDVHDNNDKTVKIDGYQLATYEWEIYQEPIDWQYIIDNKCPCLFWNSEDDAKIDFLTDVNDNIHSFVSRHSGFINCRPVRRDEVTFYEEKEDVL